MTGAELNNAFLHCLPIVDYPSDPRDAPRHYDFIKKIIYWRQEIRNGEGEFVDVIKVSCVLAYDDKPRTTSQVPIERIRIVNALTKGQPIEFVMDEKIKSAFQEKKPITVKVLGKIKVDYENIRKLILEINDDKTKIEIKCTCGEGLSAVTEPIANVKVRKKAVERINYKSVIELFNKLCPELPKVQKLTDGRKTAIKSAKESGIDFATFFLKVHKSDFLSGRNGQWKNCSFDWCLKPANRVKIVEGNFDNKQEETPNLNSSSYDIEELEKIE